MRKIIPFLVMALVLYLSLFTNVFGQNQIKTINFSAAEAESMVFLFNQTTIKGSDVDVVAPLSKKLNTALKSAKALEDKTKPVPIELSLQELQICLNVINNATFEARYAELVLGMKSKIKAVLPSQVMSPAQVPATGQ